VAGVDCHWCLVKWCGSSSRRFSLEGGGSRVADHLRRGGPENKEDRKAGRVSAAGGGMGREVNVLLEHLRMVCRKERVGVIMGEGIVPDVPASAGGLIFQRRGPLCETWSGDSEGARFALVVGGHRSECTEGEF